MIICIDFLIEMKMEGQTVEFFYLILLFSLSIRKSRAVSILHKSRLYRKYANQEYQN